MTYYVRVTYYDDNTDVEEYQNIDEAQEAYAETVYAMQDKALGDVYSISCGKTTTDGMKRISAVRYD